MPAENIFNKRVIMAPMAGVNTPAFCEVLRDLGCDFIYTGLITSHGLINHNKKTQHILGTLVTGVTLSTQIFGSDPDVMAESARILEASGKASLIDINMGCPVPKVVKSCSGVGLMREPQKAAKIVRSVVAAVKLPITVKLRAGWDNDNRNFSELAIICEAEGASAVSLHPRTKTQGFSGHSDWSLISRLKETVSIPVIASGDIASPQDAERCFRETGCDSVMIGRACMGDPGLINRASLYIQNGELLPPPDFRERIGNALKHFRSHVEIEDDAQHSVREMRSHIAWYLKGLPGAATLRSLINTTLTLERMEELLLSFKSGLERLEP